jgi:hypothetical protein
VADETDVEAAIAGVINAALYPAGDGSTSVADVDVRVMRGWPAPEEFNQAKANNYCIVSVATRNGVERNVTRYPREWQETAALVHTLTATVSGNTVTIGGAATKAHSIVVLCATNLSFAYAAAAGATLSAIAAGLAAAAVAAGFAGSSSVGPVVTVGGTPGILRARLSVSGIAAKEVKRQDKSFQVSVWAPPHPTEGVDADKHRSNVVKVIDPALAALTFFDLGDATSGFIRYERTITMDLAQEEGLYRRDLFYSVEYPTIVTETDYEIATVTTNIIGGQGNPPEGPPVPYNI